MDCFLELENNNLSQVLEADGCWRSRMTAGAKVVTIWFAKLGLRALWRFNPCWLNHCAEKSFKQYSIVDAGVPNNTTYIALLVHARRPSLLNMK